jgi:two-component system, OmpR family, phosphate regulon sensor histidine kinase PhoR
MKNLKPFQLAFLLSLPIGIISVLLTLIADHIEMNEPIHDVGLGITIFVFSFLIIFTAIERFIYRKIKLIYKSIHHLKLGKDLKYSLGESISDDPLQEVEKEVLDWAIGKKMEIDELKKVEKFRREFLTNLSHELKTPLFSAQGYIQTLLDGAIDDLDVNKKFLEKSNKSIERLCVLVDDLDEISKLESGEIKLYFSTFDMNALSKEVFESLEIKAAQKQIHFSIKKGCEKPFMVNADRVKIVQVVTNLMENSIKYGKQNGATVVGFYEMGDNLLVEVTDDGIGIDENHLPRLFERFYRVDKSRSRDEGGTGLGLSIVKHILEAHEQTIHVRSTYNVGSTFGFTLKRK